MSKPRPQHYLATAFALAAVLASSFAGGPALAAQPVGPPNPPASGLSSATAAKPVKIGPTAGRPDEAVARPTKRPLFERDGGGENEDNDLPMERGEAFYLRRIAGDPSANFTMQQAAVLRSQAADAVLSEKNARLLRGQRLPTRPNAFDGAWTNRGPDPMVLVSRSDNGFDSMTGRIGGLAIRSSAPYTIYLGGAQGGLWTWDWNTYSWTPKTDQLPSLATGAVALAPSNEDIVYVGTGEGALSGDSYFGNGVYKSTDGGATFAHVSGNFFKRVSIAKLVVHPTDPDIVYVATVRGRGGARRTSPPDATTFGVWKSTDGGTTWSLTMQSDAQGTTFGGVGDLVIDPQEPDTLLAGVLGQGISRTVDGGVTWSTTMAGLPSDANWAQGPTRFALGGARIGEGGAFVVYAGFEYYDNDGVYFPSTVWKSDDGGLNWAQTNTAVVGDYCGTQCWYDNVIGVDPSNPNVVYALGLFDYANGRGGIFRSSDGGASWVDLGWNQHPDFHAIAFRADAPDHVVIGNDGGVWYSPNRGGRNNPADPYSAVDWVNLNGNINRNNALVITATHIVLGQFTSIGQGPSDARRLYGGTQDNGTLKSALTINRWVDYASGDGGQVLVDPMDPSYVYGTYFGITPYRFDDGMTSIFGNVIIDNGINTSDRSEFYIPWVLDKYDPSRLYLGTYRLYRTSDRGDHWEPASGDLTSGCTGPAPNGGRGCVISAIGDNAGSNAVWTGSEEGYVYVTTDVWAATPTWTRVDKAPLPGRPIASIAVDRSNYRVAYLGVNGFNAATPGLPGHIFKTTDMGATWTDISGDLPDVPVNSVLIDRANPNTLYIGTDVGPMMSTNGGTNWTPMGTGFPIVAIWQLDLNPYTRQIAAGTHGRGAWVMRDQSTLKPALEVRKSIADVPVGPNQLLTYMITIGNLGNVTGTQTTIVDSLPPSTTFVSASHGGELMGDMVHWHTPGDVPMPTVNATGGLNPGQLQVLLTVRTDANLHTGDIITNDGLSVTTAENANATGSPFVVTISAATDFSVSPDSQFDGARPGQNADFSISIHNAGFLADVYDLAASGNTWPVSFFDAGDNPIASIAAAAGATVMFKARVSIPPGQVNGRTDTASIGVTSTNDPSMSHSASLETEAVGAKMLLLGWSGWGAFNWYRDALDAAGAVYNQWNLAGDTDLPLNYLKAYDIVIMFTGGEYPQAFTPYEPQLTAFLDNGGKLFMSSFDGLDQAGGTTAFVHDYLHIDWDGSETQNDKSTDPMTVTAAAANPVYGTMAPFEVYNAGFNPNYGPYNNWITPISPAVPAFMDTVPNEINGLTVEALSPVTNEPYKVVFISWPAEGITSQSVGNDLMARTLNYFGATTLTLMPQWQPIVANGFDATVLNATLKMGGVPVLGASSARRPVRRNPAAGAPILFSTGEFNATLSGENEVPPSGSAATGTATFVLDPINFGLSYRIEASGLSDVTAAHVHAGNAGSNGGVKYLLCSGASCTFPLTGTLQFGSVLDAITLMNYGFYVNVHTAANPAGAIRGQLVQPQMNASLASANEVPPPSTVSWGNALFTYDTATRHLTYRLDVGSDTTASAAHIHDGVAGVNGPVLYNLVANAVPGYNTLSPGHSLIGEVALSAADEVKLLNGGLYVNVHTAAHPAGAMRGQIGPLASNTDPDGIAYMPLASTKPGLQVVYAASLPDMLVASTVQFNATTDATKYFMRPLYNTNGLLKR